MVEAAAGGGNHAPPTRRCPKCKSLWLTLIEHFHGTAEWVSGEWTIGPDDSVRTSGEGYAESHATARWSYRCEDCDHEWTRRKR